MPRAVARACVSSEGPWGRVRTAGPRWYLIWSPEGGDGEGWGTEGAAVVTGPCCPCPGAGAGATVGTGTSGRPFVPTGWEKGGGASGGGCGGGCVEGGVGVAAAAAGGAALPAARHGLAVLTGASGAAFSAG
jgi:hypothetical protein